MRVRSLVSGDCVFVSGTQQCVCKTCCFYERTCNVNHAPKRIKTQRPVATVIAKLCSLIRRWQQCYQVRAAHGTKMSR